MSECREAESGKLCRAQTGLKKGCIDRMETERIDS